MGTNYYRIPSESEVQQRHLKLQTRVRQIDLSAKSISQGFSIDNPDSFDRFNPWDEFTEDVNIHLGKRSGGWKFCWNFHDDKYYTNKEKLFAFIRSGRVIDEYGEELTPDEFIEMAMNWCTDGWDTQSYYKEHPPTASWLDYTKYADRYVDGLRISSSTDFC